MTCLRDIVNVIGTQKRKVDEHDGVGRYGFWEQQYTHQRYLPVCEIFQSTFLYH